MCILGDLTRDPQYWRQAWTAASDGRHYARAMRSLGSWHYKRCEFPQSIECYQKALSINALFENSWFTLGCAAMQTKQWEVAQQAFARCVALETENGEAWNNLAAVYLQIGRKRDALRCLREGLKDKRENWKMWENFFFLALDLGEFSEALLGAERVLTLRWRKDPLTVDFGALEALVTGILGLAEALTTEFVDENTAGKQRSTPILQILRERLEEILRTVTVDCCANRPESWRLLARFYQRQMQADQYLKALQSAYRAFQQSAEADQLSYDENLFKECSQLVGDLAQAYLDAESQGRCGDGRFQARLILRGFLKRTKVCVFFVLFICVCVNNLFVKENFSDSKEYVMASEKLLKIE